MTMMWCSLLMVEIDSLIIELNSVCVLAILIETRLKMMMMIIMVEISSVKQ